MLCPTKHTDVIEPLLWSLKLLHRLCVLQEQSTGAREVMGFKVSNSSKQSCVWNRNRKANKRDNTPLVMPFDWWGCSSETPRQWALQTRNEDKKNKMENLMYFPLYNEKVESVKSVWLPCWLSHFQHNL